MGSAALLVALCLSPTPSPAEAGRLTAYVGNLNHPRYAVREAASKRLTEAGGVAKGVLKAAAEKGDAEVSARAKAALESIIGGELESLRPLPEIDAAWRDPVAHVYAWGNAPPGMYRLMLESLATAPTPGPWSAYYRASEWWARGELERGVSPKLLRLQLSSMHRRDADFLSRAGDVGTSLVVDADAYLRGR